MPRRLLYFLAPLLLVAVACVQLVLVQTHDLTAWKGGGFGMFSTFDDPSARTLRVVIVTAKGEAVVAFPELGVPQARVLNMPNTALLREIAERAAQTAWVLYPHGEVTRMKPTLPAAFRRQLTRDRTRPASGERPEGVDPTAGRGRLHTAYLALQPGRHRPGFHPAEVEPVAVRVEAWRMVFDGSRRQLRGEVINSITVEVP